MKLMTTAQVEALNAAYSAAVEMDVDASTHIVTHQVAVNANLETVQHDDESGTLYRTSDGAHVYGWESGGFSTWNIED